jgi:hypothetical protein
METVEEFCVKFAVSLIAPFIVMVAELLFPEYDPAPDPVQLLNVYPLVATALMPTLSPLLCQPLPGVTLLPPEPLDIVR